MNRRQTWEPVAHHFPAYRAILRAVLIGIGIGVLAIAALGTAWAVRV